LPGQDAAVIGMDCAVTAVAWPLPVPVAENEAYATAAPARTTPRAAMSPPSRVLTLNLSMGAVVSAWTSAVNRRSKGET